MVFALAHMSCAGAWAWGEVPARLRAAGHEVVAPDFALHAGVTADDHAAALADATRARRPPPRGGGGGRRPGGGRTPPGSSPATRTAGWSRRSPPSCSAARPR